MKITEKINPKNYFLLENVPGGYPLEVAYINLGALIAKRLQELKADPGSMLLIFESGGYNLYLEKEKWLATGKKVLSDIVESEEKVCEVEKGLKNWIKELKEKGDYYEGLNWDLLSEKEILQELDKIVALDLNHGFNICNIASPNYGTNLICQQLEKTVKEIGYEPNRKAQILLRATGEFPVLEYERAIGKLALLCLKKRIYLLDNEIIKKHKEIEEQIKKIRAEYGWLDASINRPPKSTEAIIY